MNKELHIFELFPWITSAFVLKVIENSEATKCIVVKTFDVNFAFKNGENFSSHMIALVVNFTNQNDGIEKQRNFLIKIAIQSDDIAMVNKECHNYETEIEVYTKILPAVEEWFNSIGLFGPIAPRCFMSDIEKSMLVFEDLRDDQFKIVNSMDGLDAEHLKLTLFTLAKWHAATATLLLTNRQLFNWCTKGVDYRNTTMVKRFYNSIAKSISNTVKNWSGFEMIAKKLENIPQHVHDSMYDVYGPHKNTFNVLTHGDMFLNNILFQHDQNGKAVDIRFVDFPFAKHTSPAIDLVCLLFGSANSSIRQCDREHLIQYYHFELVKHLKFLNFPGSIPTLLDIQSAVFHVDYYNALIVLFILGLRYVDTAYEGGFLEAANDSSTHKMYSHPKCIEQLKFTLDLFDRRGYLDY